MSKITYLICHFSMKLRKWLGLKIFECGIVWNCAGRQNVRLHVRNNVYSYHFGGFCVFQLVNRVNFNFMYSIGVSRNGKTQIIVTPFLFCGFAETTRYFQIWCRRFRNRPLADLEMVVGIGLKSRAKWKCLLQLGEFSTSSDGHSNCIYQGRLER